MFKKDDSDFNIRVEEDYIIDEKANQFIALRKMAWGEGKEAKWDIRKWISKPDGTEQAMKGTGFLTDEGPHNLAVVLCSRGFGSTVDILNGIKDRDDFKVSLNKALNLKPGDEYYDDKAQGSEFYDPCSMLDELGSEIE